MFNRLLEILFHLKRGYLSSPGEFTWHFEPHWPGPLLGEAGRWQNYLLGVVAVALLILLSRQTATRQLRRTRVALSAGAAAFVALMLIVGLGVHGWTIAMFLVAIGAIAWMYFTKREVGVTAAGRIGLALLLLAVISGALAWNLALSIGGLVLVVWVYRREGRSAAARITLGVLRASLLAFVLALLNYPTLTRSTTLTEPSVVAVLIDNSLSMSIHDVGASAQFGGPTRLQSALDLLTGQNQELIRSLAKIHSLWFYSFAGNAHELGQLAGEDERKAENPDGAVQSVSADPELLSALSNLKADGATTQVVSSIMTVLNDLQGRRLAGVVILTDGRDTPSSPLAEAYKILGDYHVKVYPVPVGSAAAPRNIELQSMSVQDSAFKDDIVNVKLTVRGAGYEPGHAVKIRLVDNKTNLPLKGVDGKPSEKTIQIPDANPVEEELLFKPEQIGALDVRAEAEKQPGELDEEDNVRMTQVSVLDAKIVVLFVEGGPRWEYRYIKNEMIRDKTIDISCILTSADPTFAQEHTDLDARGESGKFKYFPFSQFPVNMDQLMECDVVLFGDVDPREFSNPQLQLVADFVSRKGGGFGMVAGPRFAPGSYRNTPIEPLLPVSVGSVESYRPPKEDDTITEGFLPVLTREGEGSSIFRFFNDRKLNARFMRDGLQPLFWYCKGITTKPGVGEVYAEHPTDLGPDGRKAPLLVVGRFGAGRTLFSAYDDSWRWRFYTGESVFDTYWVQQLRYLARSKKLGQRQVTFTLDNQTYEPGKQVHVGLRVMNPALSQQLPPEISVQVKDRNDQTVRMEKLVREKGQPDYYTASFTADQPGQFMLRPTSPVDEINRLSAPLTVIVPRLELAEPQVDRTSLARVAGETGGQQVAYEEARAKLPSLIPSAAVTTQPYDDTPLWDKPAAMAIFVLLLTAEWVLRKAYGMV